MRGPRVVSNCGQFLSHSFSNALQHRYKLTVPAPGRDFNKQSFFINQYKMSSTVTEEEKWPALRVRETFLDFFKRNGHTFGEIDFYGTYIQVNANTTIQCHHLLLCHMAIQLCSLPMLA